MPQPIIEDSTILATFHQLKSVKMTLKHFNAKTNRGRILRVLRMSGCEDEVRNYLMSMSLRRDEAEKLRQEILSLHAQGLTRAQIVVRCDVSREYVRKVLNGGAQATTATTEETGDIA